MEANDLARKIRNLRAANNMTLEQVASVVGVGKSTVRKWETGMIANMRRDKIAALAVALHTTPAYLMGWEEEATEPPIDIKSAIRTLPKDVQEIVNLCMEVPGLAGDLKVIAQTIINRRAEK